MKHLRFHLFGGVRVTCEECVEEELTIPPSAQALLAYLLLFRKRRHRREVLIETFWGERDEERARRCLSTTLWRLRRRLEPAQGERGNYLVTTSSEEIGFNTDSNFWLDVAAFEDSVSRCLRGTQMELDPAMADELEMACRLYDADLLEGFFDDWALRERERLRILYLRCLSCLMCYHGRLGNYQKGLGFGQRILELDPLREETHRELMRLYAAEGQRALAVQQFQRCRALLDAELGITPMIETKRLIEKIRQDSTPMPSKLQSEGSHPNLKEMVRQLNQAVVSLDEAHSQVRHAMQLVRRYLEQPATEQVELESKE